ncbi:hypothetical protein XM38_049750 [Halomicronema hongdechloris C2206]|uniref:Uncharacterized protein n=1 Tax=Halomicronema hongdechloris C2206 TaxID=1641165 RepID=A0A1Z3HUK4_9CYAN|nr:hypothetical protein [Halomicronema hongdechloris]ASC74001.1 hypothetical protein XM38_049750 [Halomicronema hongdechloris C2206]
MSTLAAPSGADMTCPPAWSTIRFRRAKDRKGWALLGIPQPVYPLVALRLFELRARLMSRHDDGSFISVLFEAPPAVAAKLARVFPAPPGCEALKVSESGDRILSGKAAKSTKAIAQRLDPTSVELEAA